MRAAAFIHEAAFTLRVRASGISPGPWVHDYMGTVADCDDDPVASATFDPNVAEYIQLVAPNVGLALADWLDAAADEWAGSRDVDDHAVYVAEAILGRTWMP